MAKAKTTEYNNQSAIPTETFKVTVGNSFSSSRTKESILAELKAIEDAEQAEKERQETERKLQIERERSFDMELLDGHRAVVDEVNEALQYVTAKDEVAELIRRRKKAELCVKEIETKYGINQLNGEVTSEFVPQKGDFIKTAWKIAALLLACWGIVLYSGDWIVAKYPVAAVYNEVSFQKVLFGFSVFVGGVVSTVVILVMFFPGIGRYFNPFNGHSLDFFDDFKTLTAWQRNVVALVLFLGLLLAFVSIVSGKLD